MAKHFPPVEDLRECFDYDPETGELHWWNRRWAGTRAFPVRGRKGHLVGRVSFDGVYHKMLAHRVAWIIVRHPVDQVGRRLNDHSGNRLRNLREGDNAENNWKAARSSDLPRGVSLNGMRFTAGITDRGTYTYLGTFDTPKEASAVWQAEAKRTRAYFLEAA